MTIDDRLAAPEAMSPEMTSLNMGTMNFGLVPALDRFKESKHAWESPYLEGTRAGMFKKALSGQVAP